MSCLAHRNGELIHDTAVDAVELVLGILANQCQILIRHIKTEHIAQDESGQHFHRCGRRQSGTVRNIAEQHEIHTGLHFHALLAERPHHTLRVVRPVCFLLRL